MLGSSIFYLLRGDYNASCLPLKRYPSLWDTPAFTSNSQTMSSGHILACGCLSSVPTCQPSSPCGILLVPRFEIPGNVNIMDMDLLLVTKGINYIGILQGLCSRPYSQEATTMWSGTASLRTNSEPRDSLLLGLSDNIIVALVIITIKPIVIIVV